MGNLGHDAEEVAVEHAKKTSAREIIKKIKGWINDNPSMAKKRWPFELLQNAIDTAKKYQKQVKIDIKLDENKRLVFKHNGGPFSHEELCAIVYGGTTKTGLFTPEEKYIGRFGRGFLVSHILSKIVKIKGIGKDKEGNKHSFEISINRTSEKEDDIVSEIENCFEQLNNAPIIKDVGEEEYAEYMYELKDGIPLKSAEVGIETLEKLTPLILSFNKELIKITINNQTFTKREEDTDTNLSKISIMREGEKYGDEILLYTATEHDIAVCLMSENNEISNLSNNLPRLFVSMPIMGSEVIPIPFIISSPFLEPSEERDALLLGGENEDVKINKKLLEKAFDCFYNLVGFCIKKNYKQIYRLCHFSVIPKEYFTQKEDYWKFWEGIIKNGVKRLQDLEIIRTPDGFKKPLDVFFPIPGIKDESRLTEEQFHQFYDIVSIIKKSLPIKETAYEWQQAVAFWRNVDISIILKFYSLVSLSDEIKNNSLVGGNFQSISTVAQKLGIEDRQLKELLQKSFELFDRLYEEKKINSDFVDCLLLNQSATILTKSFCITDINKKKLPITLGMEIEKIPDAIKDISGKIAYDIRSILLDENFSRFKIVKDFLAKEITIDNIIEDFLKYKPTSGKKADFKNEGDKGWANLFVWCIINDKIKSGFPVYSKDNIVKIIDNINSEPFLLLPFKEIDVNTEYEELGCVPISVEID